MRYELGEPVVFKSNSGKPQVGVVVASLPKGDSFTYRVELPEYQSWAHESCRPATSEERESVRPTDLRAALIDAFVDRHIIYPTERALGQECQEAIRPFEKAMRAELGKLDLDDLRLLNHRIFFAGEDSTLSPVLKDVRGRLVRRSEVVTAIVKADREGLYDVSEHLSGSGNE